MMDRTSRIAAIAYLLWVSAYMPVSAQTKSPNTGHTPAMTQQAGATFAPVEQWQAAVVSGDWAKLRALYSSNPAARVVLSSGETSAETDIAFWIGLKAKRIKLNVAESASPRQDLQQVAFE